MITKKPHQNVTVRSIDEITSLVSFLHDKGALYIKFDGFECAFTPPAVGSRELPYDMPSEPEETIKSWMTQRPIGLGSK